MVIPYQKHETEQKSEIKPTPPLTGIKQAVGFWSILPPTQQNPSQYSPSLPSGRFHTYHQFFTPDIDPVCLMTFFPHCVWPLFDSDWLVGPLAFALPSHLASPSSTWMDVIFSSFYLARLPLPLDWRHLPSASHCTLQIFQLIASLDQSSILLLTCIEGWSAEFPHFCGERLDHHHTCLPFPASPTFFLLSCFSAPNSFTLFGMLFLFETLSLFLSVSV